MESNEFVPVSVAAESIPLLTLRGRRGGPLPAFLNVEVLRVILAAIREGAWDYVACQAAGVPKTTFEEWKRRGRADADAGRDTEYSRFSGLVEQARTYAIVRAETQVFRDRPDLWLTKGPGRASAMNPEGWGLARRSTDASVPPRVVFKLATSEQEPSSR